MYEKKLHFKQDIDVRGMRGDEALQAVTYFIDDAILVGMSRVRILHGTGTGILRTLIRQYLETVPGVRHFAIHYPELLGRPGIVAKALYRSPRVRRGRGRCSEGNRPPDGYPFPIWPSS